VAWEGEEEAGSPHLAQILEQNQALLQSDVWLIGDGPVHQSGQPMIYFGARGVMGLRLTLYGPVKALHDGHYGNWVPNPAAMAAELIAQMRDDDGNVLIPGFDDGVRALNPAELAAIRTLPPIDEALRQEFGIARSEGTQSWAASIMRPALNVRGLRSGQVGEEAANAIPVDAEVSLDFRLVPDQTVAGVQRAVEQFLRQKGWTLVNEPPDAAARLRAPRIARLQWESGYPALRSDMSSPVAQAIIATASRSAAGPVAVLPMMGGSVPLYLFAQRFNVPIIGLPIVNHDNNQHAANENLRLQNLWDGIDTYAGMIAQLHW
jgi:acetylornithine deacetylase/succinyl-diaminopimelate desuccinylase-like protein